MKRWRGVTLLYGVLVSIHLGLGLGMRGPVVYSDEGAYLGTAHLLVHGSGLLFLGTPYHPGYGTLLAPLVWAVGSPLGVYRGALVLNAFLLGTVGVLAFAITGWLLPRQETGRRLMVAVVVAAYPAFLAYSNLAMSMNLFIPLLLGTCVAVGRGLATDRPLPWMTAGVLGGATYCVHPQGVVVVGALLAIVIVVRRPWPARVSNLCGALVGLGASIAVTKVLIHRVTSAQAPLLRQAVGAHAVTSVTSVPAQRALVTARDVTSNLSLGHMGANLVEAAGQIFYLSAATYGLFVMGVALGLVGLKRVVVSRDRDPAQGMAAFIVMVMVGTLVASILRIHLRDIDIGNRADDLIYGRFNENALAPVLVLGAVVLGRLRGRRLWQALLWPIAMGVVTGVAGLELAAGRSGADLGGKFVDVNVLGLDPLLTWRGGIDVGAAVAVGLGVTLLIALLARWRGLWAAGVPIVVLGLASASFSAVQLTGESDGRRAQRVVLSALERIERRFGPLPGCVAYDTEVEHEWHVSNDQFFRPYLRFHHVDTYRGEVPCSPILITARWDLFKNYPGAGLMTLENYSPTNLWILPGPLLDQLKAAGLILPAVFPGVLPATAYRSSLSIVTVDRPGSGVASGEARHVGLEVKHVGSGSPWPSHHGFVIGQGWVRIHVAWASRADPTRLVAESSAELPETVYPGDTVVVNVPVIARDLSGKPLHPGDYVARIGLVQDGYTFFTDMGDHTLDLAIRVDPPKR